MQEHRKVIVPVDGTEREAEVIGQETMFITVKFDDDTTRNLQKGVGLYWAKEGDGDETERNKQANVFERNAPDIEVPDPDKGEDDENTDDDDETKSRNKSNRNSRTNKTEENPAATA